MNFTQVPLYSLPESSEFYLWDEEGDPCKELHYRILEYFKIDLEEAILVQHEETAEKRLLYSWVNCWIEC